MKKIIAALDGLKLSGSTISYAVELAKQTPAHLIGVFLDDFTYHSYKIMDLVDDHGISNEKMVQFKELDREIRDRSTEAFETACQDAGLNYSIHHDRSFAIPELLHESLFADLLIIERRETFTHYEHSVPTNFLRDALSEVQCPVMVVPVKYKTIDKNVFLYDGSPASIFAIKMFSYVIGTSKQMFT